MICMYKNGSLTVSVWSVVYDYEQKLSNGNEVSQVSKRCNQNRQRTKHRHKRRMGIEQSKQWLTGKEVQE